MKYIRQTKLAIIGGDQRQLAVAEALSDCGAEVKVFGDLHEADQATYKFCSDLTQLLEGVKAVVLPITGINEAGQVRRVDGSMLAVGESLKLLDAGTILLSGSFTKTWLDLAQQRNWVIYEYAEDDALAILNSVPTAEGALQLAMEQLPITIRGCRTLVIGFGRVGATVARSFKINGAMVTVASRRRELLARAWELGCQIITHDELNTVLDQCDLIINTVPALVLDRELLKLISADTLVIDLASAPGGVDFSAAEEYNIQAILALGLPGKVAPKTAGAILAQAIPEILEKLLADGGEG